MSTHRSPFDRLRQKYDRSDSECRQCGYHDTDDGWDVTTSGDRIHYQFVCPVCDAVETRELRLE
ncbi:HVO_0649 family zinc finger protein [Halobiforma nitratireducens]|uniref:Small CPxCG-related zinc finger protein n=1 Tax=Halobiforma nitratireducens JCM 10879 TaxID=1227454 RepID=M0LD93_9EURY|nr:HVO_0649 family zinc finger protein [Halobiforma nitratireducens]EMA31078.1 hypothetical protein C446_16100 [Halobiforma nitratireducens JCM 10879]